MFFNEDGILNIDESIANNEAFKSIMEDGVVTEEEVVGQANKVIDLLKKIEQDFTPDQQAAVKTLLEETGILYTVYNIHSINNLYK